MLVKLLVELCLVLVKMYLLNECPSLGKSQAAEPQRKIGHTGLGFAIGDARLLEPLKVVLHLAQPGRNQNSQQAHEKTDHNYVEPLYIELGIIQPVGC